MRARGPGPPLSAPCEEAAQKVPAASMTCAAAALKPPRPPPASRLPKVPDLSPSLLSPTFPGARPGRPLLSLP